MTVFQTRRSMAVYACLVVDHTGESGCDQESISVGEQNNLYSQLLPCLLSAGKGNLALGREWNLFGILRQA